jgi:hypothetical protein
MLLEKLTVAYLDMKFPAFYGIRMFITVVQEPATGPHAEPDESIPHPPILFTRIHLL